MRITTIKMKKILYVLIVILSFNQIQAQTWRQYNLQTAQITEIPFSYTSTANSNIKSGNRGILPDNFSGDTSRAFFPLDIVNDPNAYPWRTIVKFNDVTGILIDPYHVLTAGHAIEFHPYFKTVAFIPGYENSNYPYNYAYAEYFYLLSDYSQGSPRDYAIVKLDRPIGALSGWNGFGYNNDNSFFLNRTFNNPSYPSVAPFNGKNLFNWKGIFNSVGTEYFISSRLGVGGMSGSPAYANINNDNVVYGIVTNFGIKFNRITSNKFDAINKIIDLNTPAQFDLIPLYVNATPKVLKSGNALESLSFVLHNYSYENKSNANITVNVYLSTDQLITTSDDLIASYNYTKSFNVKSSEFISQTSSLPVINKPAGNYYIGIIISGDNNTNNNTTGSPDVAPITIANDDYVTIKGRIVSSQSNSGVSSVNMNGLPGTIKTDYNGNYEIQITTGWSGTVTPIKSGYDFSDFSTTYTNISQNTTTNYTASKKIYTISGFVKSPVAQNPVSNVKLSGLIGEPYSGSNGSYSINAYYGWAGTIIPTKGNDWILEPYIYSVNNITSNNTVNFTSGFYISGRCYHNNGEPIEGVSLDGFPVNVTSNSTGDYSVFLDSGWTGTVIPNYDISVFAPSERNYENVNISYDVQDYAEQSAITLNLKVLLAGAMYENTDTMRTVLNYKNYLPLTPPDTLSGGSTPFVYQRKPGDIVSNKFFQYHRNIVDWIIIELRDFCNYGVPIDTIAAFLRKDGKIISITGDSVITLPIEIPANNYYVIIRHRNHISIMTDNPIYLSSNSELYDFSSSNFLYYGNDAFALSNGKFAMYPGDADRNGAVNISDYQIFQNNSFYATVGYNSSDFNLDGILTGSDFNTFAPINKRRTTTNVPNATLIKFLKARR
jgi:hypothetical protein